MTNPYEEAEVVYKFDGYAYKYVYLEQISTEMVLERLMRSHALHVRLKSPDLTELVTREIKDDLVLQRG